LRVSVTDIKMGITEIRSFCLVLESSRAASNGQRTFGFHKRWGISWPVKRFSV